MGERSSEPYVIGIRCMPTIVTVIITYAHGVVLSDGLSLFYGWGGRSCAESAGSWLES